MNAFREKALWENNQRLLSQKDILKRKLAEVKEIRKNIAELEAMRTAIKEIKWWLKNYPQNTQQSEIISKKLEYGRKYRELDKLEWQ